MCVGIKIFIFWVGSLEEFMLQVLKEELLQYNLGLNLKFNKRNEEIKKEYAHENKFNLLSMIL